MNHPKLSIVIPAKEEQERIRRTLSMYGSFFMSEKRGFETEIIVVISNAYKDSDKTSRIVDDYAEKYPYIKKIQTNHNLGKGGAVSLGFSNAEGDYIGFIDADGAVVPTEAFKLFKFIEETPWLDGVLGNRFEGESTVSFKRNILAKIFNLNVKLLFNLPYKDTQCGAKFFKKEAAKSLSKKLSNIGWTFDVNLLVLARRLNLTILEQPVSWSEKEGSKYSLVQAFVHVPVELLRLKILDVHQTIKNLRTSVLGHEPLTRDHKNILIFAWRDIKHPEWGGSEVYVHKIAERLSKDHKVFIFTSKPKNLDREDNINGVEIIRRGNFLTVYIWAFIYYVVFFRHDIDYIVDVHNGFPFFTPLYSKKPKLMVCHHVHKKQWFKQFPFIFAIVGYLIEVVVMPIVYIRTKIVSVSPSTLQDLKKLGFSDKRMYLGYNSITKKIGGKFERSETPLLLYVGRIKSYKRLEKAINLIPKLEKKYPDIKLIIAGGGDHLESIKEKVRKSKSQDKIEVMGRVSDEKKWELMQKAWLFVMPSMKEGWGITIMEAASSGTPSVGYNVGGVRDSIRNNYTGMLAASDKELFELTDRLLSDHRSREIMSSNCKLWAKAFSWSKTAKVFEGLIDSSDKGKGLMVDKYYPWDLDFSLDADKSLTNISENSNSA